MLGEMHFINSSAFIDEVYGMKTDAFDSVSGYFMFQVTPNLSVQVTNVKYLLHWHRKQNDQLKYIHSYSLALFSFM